MRDLCEVCLQHPSVGVAAVPSIPMSLAYCEQCLRAGICYPWWLLVVNTAMIGGIEHAAEWWKDEVRIHCDFFGRTLTDFVYHVEYDKDLFEEESASH